MSGLKKTLNLFDATAIGIGAIIGAGIFVVLGIAIGSAGPAVIISMAIGGAVSSFTALSFAELGSALPKEGGVYDYAYEIVSPHVAIVAGSLWLFGQTVAGTAVSLGFASYFVSLFPHIADGRIVAVVVASALTALNLVGAKESAVANDALVVMKVVILALFIGIGLPVIKPANYSQFAPNGVLGVFQGAGFIFFAYQGFGRIATVGEEVKNPSRTLPLAIVLALVTSFVVYLLTAFVATGLQDYKSLSGSGSPIADAAKQTGSSLLVTAVSLGGLIATASVILTNLVGLSRVAFAMARNEQLPKYMARVHSKFGTPYISVLITGALMGILALFFDLRSVAAMASLSILATYVVVNYSAMKMRSSSIKSMSTGSSSKKSEEAYKTPLYPLIPVLGLASCVLLMFSLPWESWIAAALVVAAASAYYYTLKRSTRENESAPKTR